MNDARMRWARQTVTKYALKPGAGLVLSLLCLDADEEGHARTPLWRLSAESVQTPQQVGVALTRLEGLGLIRRVQSALGDSYWRLDGLRRFEEGA